MITLEGPDGAGKSTLLTILQSKFNLPKHEKFSTSMGGPLDNIARLAFRDVESVHTQPLSIYDRHPMVSEYVYTTAIPERIISDELFEAWAQNILRQYARAHFVVFCLPSYSTVKRNVLGCSNLICRHWSTDHSNVNADDDLSNPCTALTSELTRCPCPNWQPRIEMPGVVENLAAIYQMYRLLITYWPEPNRMIVYDYNNPESIKRVFSRCQIHISEWRKSHAQ